MVEKSRLEAFVMISEAINRQVAAGLGSVLSEAGNVIRVVLSGPTML